jgi:hypothetical protein
MKSPDLKIRYAKGLGDIIACILHSKSIGWLTHLITGNDKPCTLCSQRRHAWNFIFPIKVWRLFFKNEEAYIKSIAEEYKNDGHEVNIAKGGVSTFKGTIEKNGEPLVQDENDYRPDDDSIDEEQYNLLSNSKTKADDILIVVSVYKRK